MITEKNIKLTVCVVTYNQRDYIRECLESIVSQVTDFDFEVVIGDDCSKDGTTEIVHEFQMRHPERIRMLERKKNLGAVFNYRDVHLAARGQYVAHMDGDDCMLPGKLQEQVDILDCDKTLSAVFHKLEIIDLSGKSMCRNWPESAPEKFNTDFLLANHPVVGHSAMMYRNGLLHDLLTDTYNFIDFRVYFELSLLGLLGYIDKPLGRYREGVGISSKNNFLDQILSVLDVADIRCQDKEVARRGRAAQLFRASLNEFYRSDYSAFIDLIEKSRLVAPIGRAQGFFYFNRRRPRLLNVMSHFYRWLRSVGVVKDLKMSLKR